jgi:hypothetical protein
MSDHDCPLAYFAGKQFMVVRMKQFRQGLPVVCGVLALVLVSCSPKKPATRQDRQKWNLATLQGSYQSAGHKNPKWDKDAEDALGEFAQLQTASEDEVEALSALTGDAAENAVSAGCDDPMVRYLYARFSQRAKGKPLGERQGLYRAAATTLESSAYPPVRKFYANVGAAEILWQQRDTNRWPEVRQFREAAVVDLIQSLQERTLPEAEAFQAAQALFELLARNAGELTNAYNRIEAALSGQGGKSATAEFIKAEFYMQYAWRARGHGTADKVTQEGWRLFHERLATAEQALKRAWSWDPQDPQIPTLMISIVLGQQAGRAEMEKWFERAMKVDPNNYPACRAKLHFLLPQWYGSREDMVAFGRECVAKTNWGGRVPLILVDAHSEFARTLNGEGRAAYWTLPDVWPDIRAGYERFAQAKPDAARFRYPYAWYAFRCGQMDEFKTQIKLIGQNDGEVKYGYFGGKAAFDRAMALANGQEAPTNAAPAP